MLFRNLVHDVGQRLSDVAPQFKGWKERQFVDAANAGQRAIAKFLPPAAARTDVVRLQPGSYQRFDTIAAADIRPGYGPALTAPVTCMQVYRLINNMGTDGLTPGRPVFLSSQEALDAFMPEWFSNSGGTEITDYGFDPRTPTVVQVYPPLSAQSWVRMSYQAQPVEIPHATTPGDYSLGGSSSQGIGISDAYADDLANYMTAFLLMGEQEHGLAPLAQSFVQMFVGSINAQAMALTGSNPNLTLLPMAPAPAAQAS